MKQTFAVIAVILALTFADNLSDNPEVNPATKQPQSTVKIDTTLCPNCGDTTCIYVQIEEEIKNAGGDGTDTEIQEAAQRVFILRNITDSATMQNVLANYYL